MLLRPNNAAIWASSSATTKISKQKAKEDVQRKANHNIHSVTTILLAAESSCMLDIITIIIPT
eukprot:580195-Amphidinium_carterae.1